MHTHIDRTCPTLLCMDFIVDIPKNKIKKKRVEAIRERLAPLSIVASGAHACRRWVSTCHEGRVVCAPMIVSCRGKCFRGEERREMARNDGPGTQRPPSFRWVSESKPPSPLRPSLFILFIRNYCSTLHLYKRHLDAPRTLSPSCEPMILQNLRSAQGTWQR